MPVQAISLAHFISAVVSAPFQPSSVPGLVLWLRGDLGISLNGSTVSAWADQSGNGNNATQSTGSSQPVLTTSIGGQQCVSFNASGKTMTFAQFLAAGAKTIVFVRKLVLVPAGGFLQLGVLLNNGTTGCMLNYQGTGPTKFFYADCANGVSVATLYVPEALDANPHLDVCTYNGGTNNATTSYAMYLDGALESFSSGGATGSGDPTIASAIGVSSSLHKIDIAEIIVYSNQISTSDRNKLGGYIQTRYGITVAGATF
jgi:hypothetical protein